MCTNRIIRHAAILLVAFGGFGLTDCHTRADEKKTNSTEPSAKSVAKPAKAREIHEALQRPMQPVIEQATELSIDSWVRQFAETLAKTNVMIVPDQSLRRGEEPIRILGGCTARVKIPAMPTATVEKVITAVLSDLGLTFQISDGVIRVTRGYVTTLLSTGNSPKITRDYTAAELLEQEEGERITLNVEEKPLTEVLRDLHGRTGANIVLDVREKEKAKTAVSASLSDVRLMAALRILSDMCDLQPVFLNNIFYVTSKENADRLQKEIDRRRKGEETMPPPKPPETEKPQ